jgi:hypothetical protein
MGPRGEKEARKARKAAAPGRKRIAAAEHDVRRGMKDTDRRGTPNDVPVARKTSRA